MNIDYVGIAPVGPYNELEKILRERFQKGQYTGFEEQNIKRRIDARETMSDAKSVIVCLFPYFSGYEADANISKYAQGKDYHIIIKDKLEAISCLLKQYVEDFSYMAYVDTGPLVDRYLAYLAGLGYYGWNHHIITEQYGSYVLIGYIINNYPFEIDVPLEKKCHQCGLCIKCCPGKALKEDFQIDPGKCMSYVTQKKEELTEEEIIKFKSNKMAFGCDLCQDVCPHNKNVQLTPLEEFRKDIVYRLNEQDINYLSNKEFKKIYGTRAFGWRGKQLLLRNLKHLK